MARPRFATETYANLTARVPRAMLGQIEQYLEHLRSVHPGYGLDRSAAVRVLLFAALDQAGFPVPREAGPGDAGGGPVEAQVTLGEDHPADQAPSGADQSAPKAAPPQDHRTTGRTGRKRTTAAKG